MTEHSTEHDIIYFEKGENGLIYRRKGSKIVFPHRSCAGNLIAGFVEIEKRIYHEKYDFVICHNIQTEELKMDEDMALKMLVTFGGGISSIDLFETEDGTKYYMVYHSIRLYRTLFVILNGELVILPPNAVPQRREYMTEAVSCEECARYNHMFLGSWIFPTSSSSKKVSDKEPLVTKALSADVVATGFFFMGFTPKKTQRLKDLPLNYDADHLLVSIADDLENIQKRGFSTVELLRAIKGHNEKVVNWWRENELRRLARILTLDEINILVRAVNESPFEKKQVTHS